MYLFALIFGLIGFVDDYRKVRQHQNEGLTARQKFILQLAAAVVFLVLMRYEGLLTNDLYIPFLNMSFTINWIVYLIFAAFVIVGCVNAVNLTDGIDGLAASVTFVVMAFFTVAGVLWSTYGIQALFPAAMAGGLAAFFVYNHHPAKVFMGDTGSLFLGGAVAALAFVFDMPLVLIPVGIIYLIGLTKFKLEGRADVEKLTTIPIVGDIPLTDEKNEKDGSIAVFENQNNLMSETFRNIRTNLQFMLQNDKKVILVTSTVSGEGKSFISANLAISLSLLGKKVVIVGLDIRKPGLNKVFRLSTKEKGITLYLANPETDLMSLVQPSDINQNLYILPGGTVPPNPTELLARDGLDKAIEILKKNFDYVILDTAPVGMVTDTLLIGRVADLSVYVCRADYTHKVEYTLINELAEEKKLPNLCTVINGVDLKRRKYGYYYGYGKYGKYYGYGKRYGYGYGYGQEKGAKS